MPPNTVAPPWCCAVRDNESPPTCRRRFRAHGAAARVAMAAFRLSPAPAPESRSWACPRPVRRREFGSRIGCPIPVVRQRQLMAGTFGGERQLTGIVNPDDRSRAASSPGWRSRLDPYQPYGNADCSPGSRHWQHRCNSVRLATVDSTAAGAAARTPYAIHSGGQCPSSAGATPANAAPDRLGSASRVGSPQDLVVAQSLGAAAHIRGTSRHRSERDGARGTHRKWLRPRTRRREVLDGLGSRCALGRTARSSSRYPPLTSP
jgi:hypothetical protein